MKQKLVNLTRRNCPFVCAVLAFLYGMSLLAAIGTSLPKPTLPPVQSALKTSFPALSLVADYATEVKLFLPMVLFSLLVAHPLFAYLFLFLRGLYCGFSAAALFFWGFPVFFSAVYLVMHISILVAYTALVYALLPALKQKDPLLFAVPFLFYAGNIFLLTVIRNLVYYLFLK